MKIKTSFPQHVLGWSLVFVLLLSLYSAWPAQAGTFLTRTYSGRTYKVYLPGGYQSGTPSAVVLLLHGCTQDPDQFAIGTEMNTYAEQYNFIAVYPAQPSSANSSKCWNWFETSHQSRGSGEPALLVGMINAVKSEFSVDNDRVYVAGLSAGAAMSVILGATYPDVFAAIGVGSGLEYKAATSSINAWTAMSSGGPDPVGQGNVAYSAMGSYARVVPVMIFHGASDYTVNTTNGHQVLSQWAQTNDRASDGVDNNNIDDNPESTINGQVPGGRAYTRYIYHDQTDATVMEKYIVTGMGHAWSGGSSSGSYTDPQGPEASELMWLFFAAHPKNGTSPTTTPTATPTISGPTSTPTPTNIPPTATPTSSSPTSTPTPTNAPPTSTPTSSASELTVFSVGSEDGFAGQFMADGYSATTLKMGDKGMFNLDTYRGFLSFDTSALPDTATITSVTLRVYRKSLQGTVSSIALDIRAGYFGISSSLAQADYNAAASSLSITTFTPPGANHQYVDITFPSSAYQYVNAIGQTQFRLRATTVANFASDVLTLYGGEDGTFAPSLIITYIP